MQDFFSASSRILAQLTESGWDKEVSSLGVRHIAHVLKEGTPVPELLQHEPDTPNVKFFFHKMDALEWIKKYN